MSDLTIEGFIAFINEQPQAREIEHCESWAECAVGDYITAKGDTVPPLGMWPSYIKGLNAHPLLELLGDSPGIGADTYGELQEWLTTNLPTAAAKPAEHYGLAPLVPENAVEVELETSRQDQPRTELSEEAEHALIEQCRDMLEVGVDDFANVQFDGVEVTERGAYIDCRIFIPKAAPGEVSK